MPKKEIDISATAMMEEHYRRAITRVWEHEMETGRRDRGVVHRRDGRAVVVSIPVDDHAAVDVEERTHA